MKSRKSTTFGRRSDWSTSDENKEGKSKGRRRRKCPRRPRLRRRRPRRTLGKCPNPSKFSHAAPEKKRKKQHEEEVSDSSQVGDDVFCVGLEALLLRRGLDRLQPRGGRVGIARLVGVFLLGNVRGTDSRPLAQD